MTPSILLAAPLGWFLAVLAVPVIPTAVISVLAILSLLMLRPLSVVRRFGTRSALRVVLNNMITIGDACGSFFGYIVGSMSSLASGGTAQGTGHAPRAKAGLEVTSSTDVRPITRLSSGVRPQSGEDVKASSGTETPGIVHVASIDWDWLWARQQQLTVRLARRRRVLFVERMLSWDAALRRRRLLRRESQNLWILSPFKVIPFESLSHHLRRLNRAFLAFGIRIAVWRAGIRNPIIFYSTYDDHDLPLWTRSSIIVYDCVDRHRDFGWATGLERPMEERLLGRADLVIASSQRLADDLSLRGFHAALVRNAADVQFFRLARGGGEVHPSIKSLPKPRVGFVGYIADWVDLDLLLALARKHPEWTVVLAGRREVSEHALFDQSNVVFLGHIPHRELPSLLRGIDVCLLPFKMGPLTDSADTIKLFEYLSAGKPVVATAIAQALEFSRFVSAARDHSDFIEKVESILARGPATPPRELDDVLKDHDWDARTKRLEDLIDRAIASGRIPHP